MWTRTSMPATRKSWKDQRIGFAVLTIPFAEAFSNGCIAGALPISAPRALRRRLPRGATRLLQ